MNLAPDARRRRFSSIRFRLSLAFASAVFALGSVLVGGIYWFQTSRIVTPTLDAIPISVVDDEGNRVLIGYRAPRDEVERFQLEQTAVAIDTEALDRLRRGSLASLGVLAVASFLAGWVLSGWALRPVGRIVRVARDISTSDLARRIDLHGPDDELRDIADTFDAMLDRLQVGFHDQQRFMADASHELRNPLAIVRTHLELARDADDPDERRRSLRVAESAAERLGVLVDDVMAAARSDAESREFVELDLGRLLGEVARDFDPSARARSITLETRIAELEPIRGDELALRRAVANLVTNAVRLAPEGSTITLALDRAGDRARIDVIDEGPGIDPAHLDHVFQRFWRGPDAGRGSGLGLSIVREIAERHGGNAGVDAAPPSGSRFSLWLPMTSRVAP